MRHRHIAVGVLIIAAASLLTVLPRGRADAPRPQQRWEYKVVSGDAKINELGDAGWELVATTASANAFHFYFKRPKQ